MVARLVSADSDSGKLPDVVLSDLTGRYVGYNSTTKLPVPTILTAIDSRYDQRYAPISSGPQPGNLSGTYAARPAANSVQVGTIYYATNVLETYRSNGTVWTVVYAGGSELAYAETTSSTTVPVGSAVQDVSGVTLSIVQPERPVYLEFSAIARYVPTTAGTADPVLTIYETTSASTLVAETHAPASASSTEYVQMYARKRLAPVTAGTTRTFKLCVQQRSTAYSLQAAAAFPTWMGAFTS